MKLAGILCRSGKRKAPIEIQAPAGVLSTNWSGKKKGKQHLDGKHSSACLGVPSPELPDPMDPSGLQLSGLGSTNSVYFQSALEPKARLPCLAVIWGFWESLEVCGSHMESNHSLPLELPHVSTSPGFSWQFQAWVAPNPSWFKTRDFWVANLYFSLLFCSYNSSWWEWHRTRFWHPHSHFPWRNFVEIQKFQTPKFLLKQGWNFLWPFHESWGFGEGNKQGILRMVNPLSKKSQENFASMFWVILWDFFPENDGILGLRYCSAVGMFS